MLKKILVFWIFLSLNIWIFCADVSQIEKDNEPQYRAEYIVYPQASAYWSGSTTDLTKTETSLVNGYDTEDGWMVFDVSAIPGGTVDLIEFNGYVNSTLQPDWSITPVTYFPPTTSAPDLYGDINLEALIPASCYYYRDEEPAFSTGWKNIILENSANADLEAAIAAGWFAMGIANRNNNTTNRINFDGWNEANIPFLSVYRYTHIPGGSVSGVWILADSPYIIDGDIFIDNMDNLIIEPGVEVFFSGDYTFDIYGLLFSEATSTDSIYFDHYDDNETWSGIEIGDETGFYGSISCRYSHIKNARNGINCINGDLNFINTTVLLDTITVRDSTRVGISIKNESVAIIDSSEVEGYDIGIEIINETGIESTPTILNTRVRNSTEGARTDAIGISESGFIAAEIDNCLIEDYSYGIKYVGTIPTLDTPTILNTRIRNSTEGARRSELLVGMYFEDVFNVTISADSIIGYETGVEFVNSTVRTESTPTILNTRIRNSTEGARTGTSGIKSSGLVSAYVDSCETDGYSKGVDLENLSGTASTPTILNTRIRNSTEGARDPLRGIDLNGDIHSYLSRNVITDCDSAIIITGSNSYSEMNFNLIYNDELISNSTSLYFEDADSIRLYSNTIYSFDTGIEVNYVDSCIGYNNIFWSVNNAVSNSFSNINMTYSDSEDSFTGIGNISSYPEFADTTNNGFSLLWNSPCIDSGTGTDPGDGTPADMGAIPYEQSGTPEIPQEVHIMADEDSLEITWELSDNAISYNVYSCSDPYNYDDLTTEAADLRVLSWKTAVSDSNRFYYVTSRNSLSYRFK